MSNGHFSTSGAYRVDETTQARLDHEEARKERDYQARVERFRSAFRSGARVVVEADLDFGAMGTVVAVQGSDVIVVLDLDPDQPLHFAAGELRRVA